MRSFLLVCAAALIVCAPAAAQDPASPPAHISFVEGAVTIDRGGESQPATVNMPVVEGDRMRTNDGRAEVMFPDGSAIAIEPRSEVEFVTGTRVRVLAGAIEHHAADRDAASPSAPNLPPDLQPYAPQLDQNGYWQYEAPYGNVWYPTVSADWRPYSYGYWSPLPAYGLTWIGYDRWAWPTHHYGRWGYARSRWFWIPGRTWGAAWVSWGTAPEFVSWSPLGFDNRPLVGLSVGYRSAWNAWTIVPRDRFLVRGASLHRYAIDPYRISATTPFVMHRTAPSAFTHGRIGIAGSSAAAGAVVIPRTMITPPPANAPAPHEGVTSGHVSPIFERPLPGYYGTPIPDNRPRATTQSPQPGDHPDYRADYHARPAPQPERAQPRPQPSQAQPQSPQAQPRQAQPRQAPPQSAQGQPQPRPAQAAPQRAQPRNDGTSSASSPPAPGPAPSGGGGGAQKSGASGNGHARKPR